MTVNFYLKQEFSNFFKEEFSFFFEVTDYLVRKNKNKYLKTY